MWQLHTFGLHKLAIKSVQCTVAESCVQINHFGVGIKKYYQKVMLKNQIDTVFKQKENYNSGRVIINTKE